MSTELILNQIDNKLIFVKSRKKEVVTARHIFFTIRVIELSFHQPYLTGFTMLSKSNGLNKSTIYRSICRLMQWYSIDKPFQRLFNEIIERKNLQIQFNHFKNLYNDNHR